MESSEGTSRRSERKRKRKESYSPEGKKDGGKKDKTDGQKSQNRSKLYANRLYDILPNGEPFSCHLCKSPYVVNPMSKGVKKTGRSRHTPLPKVRTDRNTGREMMLCNACVQIFDRPQRRVVKIVTTPTEEEKKEYLQEVDHFIKTIRTEFDDPLVEKLFCPLSQKKLCGCLQKYIQSTGNSHVPTFINLMKEAVELRKEKSYPITAENKKVKLIGLGNGHKKSKRYEEFVLNKRRELKDDMRLCERATQKILMYSNNFLHKKLKTEARPCRVERTRGKAALGQLPDLHTMMDLHCCTDNCVMMALTHKRLLQDWRDRALQGQQEARRVMAEMLTPAGATHINCYSFISMVTGCSQTTIARVYNQMIDTGGIRDPPEHGMKRVWQEHYKQSKTSEGVKDTSSGTVLADGRGQEVTSVHGQTNQNTVIDAATMNAVRQHKLAWIHDLAKQQLQQQQQLALHLQEIMLNKQKLNMTDQIQNPTLQQSTLLQHKPEEMSQSHLFKTNTMSLDHLHQLPLSAVLGLQPTVVGNQNHMVTGQGHQQSGQGHLQEVLLQPPPQYGVNQSNIEKQWNKSQFTFPLNVNQTNFLLTGDQQFLPVIPVFKHGAEEQMVPSNGPETKMQDQNVSHTKSLQFSQQESVQNLVQTEHQINSQIPNQIPSQNTTTSSAKAVNTSFTSQEPVLRQYQIVSDQGTQLLNLQTPATEQNLVENVTISHDQTNENSERLISSSQSQDQGENINPNVYFQILPETTSKPFTAEKITGLNESRPTVSVQSNNYDLVAQPIPSFELHTRTKHSTSKEQNIEQTQQRLTEVIQPMSVLERSSVVETVTNGPGVEDSSTMILHEVANQADQGFQQVNQTQLIVPVSFFHASNSNNVPNEQIPSQIQISFQTCSSGSDQPNYTQQIILPHGNVVTLPLMPVETDTDAAAMKINNVNVSKENNEITGNSSIPDIAIQQSAVTNQSSENLEQHIVNHRTKILDAAKTIRAEQNALKSRNSSGDSRKSRNSSGSSEKSRKSVVHFSDTQRSESQSEQGHSILRPDHLSDIHFASKLSKSRHRQYSGNSEHGDRSRKSSGNSVISETSSYTSGLNLSNLVSPNIFHDKEKGLFFIHSLELNEIDGNNLVEFIQQVEADQTGTVENQSSDLEVQMYNQSGKSDAEKCNQSGSIHVGKTLRMKSVTEDIIHTEFDSGSVEGLKHGHFDNEHREDTHIDNDKVCAKSTGKRREKKKASQTNVKSSAAYKYSDKQDSMNKNSVNKKCKANMSQLKDTDRHILTSTGSKSFIPIAPKGSQRLWVLDSSLDIESNKLASTNNTPVLSNLLAQKPIYSLYK